MEAPLTGLGDVLVATLLATTGVLSLLLSLFGKRRVDPLLAAFGAFTLLWGTRQLFRSELIVELGFDARTSDWIDNTITYVINIPAWVFFWQLLGRGWRSIMLLWVGVVTAFAVVGVLSDLVQQTPGTLSRHPNNVLVLLGLVVAVVALMQHVRRMTGELKILVLGLSVFSVFVINENLVSMGLLPWEWREESIGFLFLVACLGWIAARHFFSKERQLATLEGELETARQIQTSLLPAHPPASASLGFAVRFQPSSAVAGDFYDFLVQDDGSVGVLVADVSGHGVPAALIASMVKVAARSHADFADRPAELLDRVNQTLCGSMKKGFVTAGYAYFDLGQRAVTVASAGHPLPLRIGPERSVPEEVGGLGPILGRFQEASYQEQKCELLPGEKWLFFTDGLLEARGDGEEIFGDQRLGSVVREHRGLDVEELCDRLLAAVRGWQGAEEMEDDLTLLVVEAR